MNAEQAFALDQFKSGKNMFLTGSAGTGKSFTLREMRRWAFDTGKNIGTTATTGSAAILVGGRTIHSYLGIGLAKKNPHELARQVMLRNPAKVAVLRKLDVLIIEEVSMMDAELFQKVSEFLKIVRGCSLSFGGLQMLLIGDMCQLPPVRGEYCFNAPAWSELSPVVVRLKQLMRQADDTEFQEILEEVRLGRCCKRSMTKLRALKNTAFNSGVKPTVLFPTNVDVDVINERMYRALLEKGVERQTIQTVYSRDQTKAWATSCKIPEAVDLCLEAQVIVTWNISQEDGIVNGTRGVVKQFNHDGVIIELKSGKTCLISPITVEEEDCKGSCVTFMPLRLAWAITIHKSQGMTLDAVVVALGDVFEYGQAYTALSRVRDMASLRLLSVDVESFKTHPSVIEFHEKYLQN